MVLLRRPQACGCAVIRRSLATLFAALLSAAGPVAVASLEKVPANDMPVTVEYFEVVCDSGSAKPQSSVPESGDSGS